VQFLRGKMPKGSKNMDTNTISSLEKNQNTILATLDSNKATLSDLLEQFKTFDARLTDLSLTVQEANNRSKEVMEKLTEAEKRIKSLEESLLCRNKTNTKLSKDLAQLSEKVVKLESHSRRDNLIFEGISESSPEDCLDKVRHIMKVNMGITNAESIKVVRCHRLGPKPSNKAQNKRPRHIIIKFHYYPEQEHVWQKRTKLAKSNIWVSEDFPLEIQNRRKILLPIAQKARKE
jgi:myosin heavy subunit